MRKLDIASMMRHKASDSLPEFLIRHHAEHTNETTTTQFVIRTEMGDTHLFIDIICQGCMVAQTFMYPTMDA